MARFALATLLLLSASSFADKKATPAPKPDPKIEAKALLEQGNSDLDAGNYLQALDEFDKAYALYPSPRLHFNIAQTYVQLGRPLDALQHYEAFLKEVKKEEAPDLWPIANDKAFELQGKVATLEIQSNIVDADVTVDGASVGKTPLLSPVRLLPGPHSVVISKDGYEKQVIDVTFKPGEGITQRVKLLTETEAVASHKAFQDEEARRAAEEKARKDAEEKLARERTDAARRRANTKRTERVLGAVGLGVGIVGGIAAGTFAGLSVLETNKVESAPDGTPWSEVSSHYSRANTFRNVAWIAGAGGGALAITGAILFAVGSSGRGETAVPIVVPGGGGVSFSGRF